MKKLVWKKLKGQAGETLTETLVALLIAALALTMLASMISSTTRIVTQSKTTMNSYYSMNNNLAEQGTAEDTATITIGCEENTNYKAASKTYQVKVTPVNPTTVTGKTLTYNGNAQDLVSVSNAEGTVYYSTTESLNSSNYLSKGSTVVPKGKDAGQYRVYYYGNIYLSKI